VRRVLAAGHDLGLLFLAMVERAPADAEAAAETTRALGLLDDATDSEQVTNQAIGLLLRGRTTAPQQRIPEGVR
jgi:TetR/AcrR family transcriptional regulator, transcriptional repressor for nem operon